MLKRSGAGYAQPQTPAINLEVEQALLGAILVNNEAYWRVADVVEEEHFSEVIHQTIWKLIEKRLGDGGSVTPTLLAADLGADATVKITDDVSLKAYVARLCGEAVTVVQASDYAKTVVDLFRTRRLRALGEDLVRWADSGADRDPVEEILRETDSELQDIAFGRSAGNIKTLGDAASEALARTEAAYRNQETTGFSFGLPTIDALCGRMMPGDLVVLLAPSHHGKTALLTQILCSVSNPSANVPVASYMVELEMQALDIARRLIAQHGRVPVSRQESGRLGKTPEEAEAAYGDMVTAASNLSKFPVFIDGGGAGTLTRVSKISARVRAMAKLRGVKIVGVDHVKLLTTSNPKWTIIDIITNAARKFKQLAMELNIPIILLAQPTRESRKRDTESLRPRVEDIYGGGVLEECADIILGLHNPTEALLQREPEQTDPAWAKWNIQVKKWKGMVEVAALKRRRGKQTGWLSLLYDGQTTTFSEDPNRAKT